EELRRHADRDWPGHGGELRRYVKHGRGIAAGERFERAQWLAVGVFEVAHAVAIGGIARARQRDVALVAAADAQALLRKIELARRRARHLLGDAFLQARFRGEEP